MECPRSSGPGWPAGVPPGVSDRAYARPPPMPMPMPGDALDERRYRQARIIQYKDVAGQRMALHRVYSLHPAHGTLDPVAVRGGCPVKPRYIQPGPAGYPPMARAYAHCRRTGGGSIPPGGRDRLLCVHTDV